MVQRLLWQKHGSTEPSTSAGIFSVPGPEQSTYATLARNDSARYNHPRFCFSSGYYDHVKITGVCREQNKALVIRGWIRLRLHTASLAAAERGLVAANTCSTAGRAEATTHEGQAAAENAEVVTGRNETKEEEADRKVASAAKSKREGGGVSWMARRMITAVRAISSE